VSFADAQVGRLLKALETAGLKDNTVVLLWGDHGWHLGEHGIWGKHALFEESLRSPLIIAYPGMGRRGEATASMVESLDIFPTLCELAGLPIPAGLDGQSLLPILEDPQAPGHPSYAYTAQAKTLRTSSHRLILHRDGFVELYDHQQPDGETQNVAAQHMDRVAMLTRALNDRLGPW
jgi:iduronate 2-sulfatase